MVFPEFYPMPKDIFQFKSFTIRQEKCAMKVGTDGVLLGAWAGNGEPQQVLDIGAGTGLVALMLAQRFPEARVTGVEVDENTAAQAKDNASGSPFAGRVMMVHDSIQHFAKNTHQQFDLIVSNPPFFDSLQPLESGRLKARHAQNLQPQELLESVDRLLTEVGFFVVILPEAGSRNFSIRAASIGLHLINLTAVRDTDKHPVKRHLLAFAKELLPFEKGEITLYEKGREERSAAFSFLTKDFYLD